MTNENSSTAKPSAPELDNRTFGLIFAGIFGLIALLPLAFGSGIRLWAAYPALAFAISALLFPVILTPLNRAWAKFGQLMHKIVNPILMGAVFFLTILPTGLIMRLLGNDPMQRKFDPNLESYWIDREDSISDEFFDNQF